MNIFLDFSILISVLLVFSMGGCRRQSGLDADTDSQTSTVLLNATDSSGGTGSEMLSPGTETGPGDTQSSTSDTATATAVIIVDTEDTVTATAVIVVDTDDTASSTAVIVVDTEDSATTTAAVVVDTEDTASDTDSWSHVPSADTGEWQTVFENPDRIALETVDLAGNGDILAFNQLELFRVAADGSWRQFSMDNIDSGNRFVQALGNDDGLWAAGYGNELFFVPNGGGVRSIRPFSAAGSAQAKHLAVFENTLYVISSWNPIDTSSDGGFGFINRWDGSAWTQVTTGEKDGTFYQLHNLENGAIVAVSYGGALAVFDGVTWQTLDSSSIGSTVRDVWGLNENDFWVGTMSLYHYDGTSFEEVPPLPDDIINGEFDQISQVNGITGAANNDMFVSVVYVVDFQNGGCVGGETCDKAGGVSVDEDVALWEEAYLAHYDGTDFTRISSVASSTMGMTEMALFNDALYMSGVRYVLSDDTVTSLTEYPHGGISVDGDSGAYFYASGSSSECIDGSRYNGTSWECLEMGSPLIDIISAPNGIVYGLTTGSEVLMWQDGAVQSIHDPQCTVLDYYLTGATGLPVARCQEGQRIAWDGTAWDIIEGPPAGDLNQVCHVGDALYGYRTVSQQSTAVRIEAGVSSEAASERVFYGIACNGSGAVLFDDPQLTTNGQRVQQFSAFDGVALTPIATWDVSTWNGSVYQSRFAVDDDYHITAVVLRDGLLYVAEWDGSIWRVNRMPDNIIVPDFTPDGRLFAQDFDTRALLVYSPQNK